ncbi:hypothetical protein TH53_19885 [Pedobacter lusitanus]|uniref:Uncharacterized protein n=1 Tax=Pedobacter lusitanus TaxID=1503925 RepID=A0A0D0GMB1_9SPHI|nr:hypothetical protein [Pedobacter lusitanus]KIO75601.1 hypothetical protein TH53_19885 [Pedobacter lusitanus]
MKFESYRIVNGEIFGDITIIAESWDKAESIAEQMGTWVNGQIVKEIDQDTGNVIDYLAVCYN